ncbi:MAG TPA: dihydropteroate synthase [Savagea sp.]
MERRFDWGHQTVVMGILNVTPDSFSDGGHYNQLEAAVVRAREMLAAGATIIDVGGESTRPGHTPVGEEEELARVIPIIQALKKELNCEISIDTYKSNVAEAAIQAGATIINDIWGGIEDPRILDVARDYQVPIILMHNRKLPEYPNGFNVDYLKDIEEMITQAKKTGIKEEQIWLDPGIGFAKNLEQNIQAMQLLPKLVAYGYPVLLGTSRKSLIGGILDIPVEERLAGSLATVSYGVMQGVSIVRVHDVRETVDTVRVLKHLMKEER